MQKQIKQQLEETNNVEIELDHYDIDEYRYTGEVIIETEDFDIQFDLNAVQTGKTVDYGRDNPPEWQQEEETVNIDNIKAYNYEQDKHYTIVDREIERLIISKLNLKQNE